MKVRDLFDKLAKLIAEDRGDLEVYIWADVQGPYPLEEGDMKVKSVKEYAFQKDAPTRLVLGDPE